MPDFSDLLRNAGFPTDDDPIPKRNTPHVLSVEEQISRLKRGAEEYSQENLFVEGEILCLKPNIDSSYAMGDSSLGSVVIFIRYLRESEQVEDKIEVVPVSAPWVTMSYDCLVGWIPNNKDAKMIISIANSEFFQRYSPENLETNQS